MFEGEGDERQNARSASGQGSSGKPTGAGAEAAEGTHGAMQDPRRRTTRAWTPRPTRKPKKNARRGSEPLTGREQEHVSGYGGKGGEPRTSSDQRE